VLMQGNLKDVGSPPSRTPSSLYWAGWPSCWMDPNLGVCGRPSGSAQWRSRSRRHGHHREWSDLLAIAPRDLLRTPTISGCQD